MNCAKIREMISERIDGALDSGKAEKLERHLRECEDCLELERDLKRIASEAASLEIPAPPDGVWVNVRSRLAEPGQGRLRAVAARTPGFSALAPRPRLRHAFAGFAALAVLALAAGGLYWGFRPKNEMSFSGLQGKEKYTLAKLDEAERYYQMAVKSLGEAVSAKAGNVPPQFAEMFQKNLEVIDATIEACRQAVRTEPDNVRARDYLLAAYKDKMSFLDDSLEFNLRAAPAEGAPGKL